MEKIKSNFCIPSGKLRVDLINDLVILLLFMGADRTLLLLSVEADRTLLLLSLEADRTQIS